MKTNSLPRVAKSLAAALAIGVFGISSAPADVLSPSTGDFSGIYKVTSSTDPIFPAAADCEWFMDFGGGFSAGKMSGNVAVSLRQNPNVKVRIMAWQYFPRQKSLIIGNPYSENSRNAVAKGVWKMRFVSDGVVFERGQYQVVLHRADPADY